MPDYLLYYLGFPYDADDLRAMQWWITWAIIAANTARLQAMLVGDGDAARQVYDDWNAILRTDQRLDGTYEPIDSRVPWNNTAPL